VPGARNPLGLFSVYLSPAFGGHTPGLPDESRNQALELKLSSVFGKLGELVSTNGIGSSPNRVQFGFQLPPLATF